MNGYVLTVIGTVLVSSILSVLIPEGKTAGLVKGVTKLACLIVLILPIPNFLQEENVFDVIRGESIENTDGFFENNGISPDKSFIEYYCELRIREAENALEREVQDKFGVTITANFSWEYAGETDIDGVKITSIYAKLETEMSEKVKTELYAYLKDSYCSEVQIE